MGPLFMERVSPNGLTPLPELQPDPICSRLVRQESEHEPTRIHETVGCRKHGVAAHRCGAVAQTGHARHSSRQKSRSDATHRENQAGPARISATSKEQTSSSNCASAARMLLIWRHLRRSSLPTRSIYCSPIPPAPALKIELMPFLLHGGEGLDDAFAQLQKGGAEALVLQPCAHRVIAAQPPEQAHRRACTQTAAAVLRAERRLYSGGWPDVVFFGS